MPVNKQLMLLYILIALPLISNSQEDKKSFVFQNEPIAQCLKKTVESYGYFLSFKKEIFNGKPSVSGKFQNKTLDEMMRLLLKSDYKYKQIKEYVIINPVIKPKITASGDRMPKNEPIVFDTVTIEEVIVKYDTQLIEKRKIIYDTIPIRVQEIIYDTISIAAPIDSAESKWNYGVFFGPVLRKRNGDNLDANYFGMSIGGSVRYNLKDIYFQLDGSFQYLLNNVTNSSITEVVETRTDTISTFFVIENGVRTPVYITEDVEVTREVQSEIDRTNTLQFLSFSLMTGYAFKTEKYSIGLELGINTDWLLNWDELLFVNNNLIEESDIQYNNPAVSIVAQLPLKFTKPNLIGSFTVTPYFQYGVNDAFGNPSPGGKRLVSGIKIGFTF